MRAHLLEPKASLAALFLRLGLAAVFIVHGYIKLYVRDQMIPELSPSAQNATGAVELACGVLLLVGLLSRVAAMVLVVFQATAIALISGKHALEVNVTGKASDYLRVGPEYNLVLIAMCLSIIVLGSGAVSLDRLLAGRWSKAAPAPLTTPTGGTA